jgi:hypothetical protein
VTEFKDKPFTYADIQDGDTIRRTESWESGSVRVYEGVVTKADNFRAFTREGFLVGYHQDDENPYMTLELVNRPETKPGLTDGAKTKA